ncbi:MAG TPA: polymer-forming cytoskeletal protein [Gemmatirosa sp.]|nr:polymer-forming cytoskeletal protein [Gemmatirosa sp.]
MALFRKREPASPPPVGDGYSVLDAQLTIVGDIETDGTLRIDGTLHGSVRRAGVVILGVGAAVHGNIVAGEVIVGGSVQGDIRALQRIELQPTATVTGDVEAGTVLIQEGGVLRGRLCVRPEGATAPDVGTGSGSTRLRSQTPTLRLAAVSGASGRPSAPSSAADGTAGAAVVGATGTGA